MIIKAKQAKAFTHLMRDMSKEHLGCWYGLRMEDVIEIIRSELVLLEEQRLRVGKPDDDVVLESLVRIAAVARFHAADSDLAYAKEIPS